MHLFIYYCYCVYMELRILILLQYIVNVRSDCAQMEAHVENWDLLISVYVQVGMLV